MKTNRLRELLAGRKPTLGTHIINTWPAFVEAVGHSGMFDYVEFVAEDASFDLTDLDNICRTAELCGLATMIKVDQEPRTFLAQRAIGAGFDSVLFANCQHAEEARDCIRIVRPDTPQDGGACGAAIRRRSYKFHWRPTDHMPPDYVRELREVVVALMIEKKGMVEQFEQILALPGLDMIQWGPGDYSLSVGRSGQTSSPEIRAIEKRVFEAALKAGIPPRCEIESPDQAKYYLDMGVRHFCIGLDLMVWYGWCRQNGEAMRRALEGL